MTDLAEVFGGHVTQSLCCDLMMSYDWQVMLSRELTQQVHQVLIHTSFL